MRHRLIPSDNAPILFASISLNIVSAILWTLSGSSYAGNGKVGSSLPFRSL
jgi:hypothetical protein